MIRRRLNYISFFQRLTTLLLPLIASAVAAYVRFGSGWIPTRHADINPSDYFALLLFTTIAWAIVVEKLGLSRFDILFAARRPARSAFWACVITYVAVLGATFFYRSASFSRLFVAFSSVALFLLVLLSHRAFQVLLERARRHGGGRVRVLMIGADDFAQRVSREVLDGVVPCAIAAFVRLAGQEATVSGSPVVELDSVRQLALAAELDDIVIAIPTERFPEIPAIMRVLEPLCLPVRAILDLGQDVYVRELLFDFGGLRMLDLRAVPSESLLYVIAKRTLDLVFSSLAIILCAPLMAAIAVLVRLTSPGPVFFVQDRVGLNGRFFRMYKFRTMRVTDRLESDTRWTTADDPRRTRLGRFLRATNLDELPQFFNVFKGEMSVVGPRPERPHFVQKFLENVVQYNSRHFLKVGITGWAQVNGWRGDTSIAKRVEHDLYYLRHWSLVFDLKIIFLTVWRSVVANRNAY